MTGVPRPVGNRPGLPRIATRAGRYADFLADLVAGLDDPARPRLADLGTRDPGDPSIALLDAWAAVCDILSLYSERFSNEAYLGTAADRASLVELARLVGYRPAPGAAAEALLAFSLERPVTAVPPGTDPGTEPHVPAAETVVPERLRIRSVPDAGQRPQVFETVESLAGRAEWNVLPVWAWRRRWAEEASTELFVRGVGLGLALGQPYLFVDGVQWSSGSGRFPWWLRTIRRVDEHASGDRTRIELEIGEEDVRGEDDLLAPFPSTVLFAKRLQVFGANAPAPGMIRPPVRNPDSDPAVAFTDDSGGTVDVAGSHPDILSGSVVYISSRFVGEKGDQRAERGLYQVVVAEELARAAYGISGPITRLTLRGKTRDFGGPRGVTVFAVPIPLEIVDAPDDTPLGEQDTLLVEGDASEMPPGRRLIVSGLAIDPPDAGFERSEAATVVEAFSAEPTDRGGPRTQIRLAESLRRRYVRASTRVFGNVARATHGETVEQLLADPAGGGAPHSLRAPAFPLANGPLTYVSARTEDGVASTLEVAEDGVAWHERASLHDAAEGERAFAVRVEPDGSVVVALARPPRTPAAAHPLRARYRVGLGTEGNVEPGRITALVDRPLGVRGASNPLPSSGGADPVAADELRARLPLQARTLGRVVSLTDYADFAAAFAGVGDALADVLPLRAGRTVVVSVAGLDGKVVDATTVGKLRASLRALGDPAAMVHVVPAEVSRFQLSLGFAPDPGRDSAAVRDALAARLRAAFSPAARRLGQGVAGSEVVAVAAAVPGVRGVDFDGFPIDDPAIPEQFVSRLDGARAIAPDPDSPIGATLLVIADDPLARLEVAP